MSSNNNVIYDATGKFAFDLFDINVMMSRFY